MLPGPSPDPSPNANTNPNPGPGGLLSDMFYARYSHRGRHWVLFGSLVLEGVALVAFSNVSSAYFARAIVVLVIFSTFVQMAEGAEFAMIPAIGKSKGAPGAVSGFVSSGGNIGAVLFTLMHTQYASMDADPREAYFVHGVIVIAISSLVPCLHWGEFGSMFFPPQAAKVHVVQQPAAPSNDIAVD
jgi:NNP family nitrate/nitrite transporter-like MFS transporter